MTFEGRNKLDVVHDFGPSPSIFDRILPIPPSSLRLFCVIERFFFRRQCTVRHARLTSLPLGEYRNLWIAPYVTFNFVSLLYIKKIQWKITHKLVQLTWNLSKNKLIMISLIKHVTKTRNTCYIHRPPTDQFNLLHQVGTMSVKRNIGGKIKNKQRESFFCFPPQTKEPKTINTFPHIHSFPSVRENHHVFFV